MSKSTGGLVIGAVGAVVGGYFGGAQGAVAGAQLGYAVGNLIDPAVIHSTSTSFGSRLDPELLIVQTSAYGVNIPGVSGRIALGGNVIWTQNIREVVSVTFNDTSSGKGGSSTNTTTYTYVFNYYCTFAVAICAGPILNLHRIRADGKLIYNTDTTDPGTLAASAKVPVTLFNGTEEQIPSSVMESFDGIGNVPAYRGLAYVVFNSLPLANYGNRIPSLVFEVEA